MKDLKDRLHNLLCNPQPHGVEELAGILRDLLDRLDTEPQCEHALRYADNGRKTVCCSCGKDVTSQFPSK